MARISLARIGVIGLIVVIGMIVATLWGPTSPSHLGANFFGAALSPVSRSLHIVGNIMHLVVDQKDIAAENAQLRAQLQQNASESARLDALEKENANLRASLGIHERLTQAPIEAGAFSYIRDGGVEQVTINRGSKDSVVTGDVVVTPEGSLVGMVQKAFDHYAVVQAIGDPSLDVAARIVGSDVTGLVHADGAKGLVLDLVQKAETVTEGQVVATSGNDGFVPGIVIGTVVAVDNTSTTLFKMVRITPAIRDYFDGSVLVIHP